MDKQYIWPPSKKELADLLLKYKYSQIAELYDTSHSTIQRLRDKYRIQAINRKDRNKLLNRTDFGLWSYDPDGDKLPAVFQNALYPKVCVYYGNKKYISSGIRALCCHVIGEIIPKFIDCHHVCGNPKCLNPRHAVLCIQQAHMAWHNGKVKQLPPELVFQMSDYCYDTGDECIMGDIPSVQTVLLPPKAWNDFLVNSMLVVDYLEEQMAREQAEASKKKSKKVA